MIRFLPAFVSAIAAMLATGMAFRARLPWNICLCLVGQSVFALASWWNLCRGPEVFESHGYRVFFGAVFGLVLILDLWVVFDWEGWLGLVKVPIVALAVFTLAWDLPFTGNQTVTVIQGGVSLVCGVLALLARAKATTPEMQYTTLALAGLWLGIGVFAWAYVTATGEWKLQNLLIPPVIGIACFGWLAWSLNGLQSERVFEPIQVQHVQLAEEVR